MRTGPREIHRAFICHSPSLIEDVLHFPVPVPAHITYRQSGTEQSITVAHAKGLPPSASVPCHPIIVPHKRTLPPRTTRLQMLPSSRNPNDFAPYPPPSRASRHKYPSRRSDTTHHFPLALTAAVLERRRRKRIEKHDAWTDGLRTCETDPLPSQSNTVRHVVFLFEDALLAPYGAVTWGVAGDGEVLGTSTGGRRRRGWVRCFGVWCP